MQFSMRPIEETIEDIARQAQLVNEFQYLIGAGFHPAVKMIQTSLPKGLQFRQGLAGNAVSAGIGCDVL